MSDFLGATVEWNTLLPTTAIVYYGDIGTPLQPRLQGCQGAVLRRLPVAQLKRWAAKQ